MQSKFERLRAKFQDEEDYFLLEKTYEFYEMRRKALEEAKEGIANVDGCIVEALELEMTSFTRPNVSTSSRTSLEYLKTDEEAEKEDKDKGTEPDTEQP